MTRPTAMIREYLLLKLMEERIQSELTEAKRELNEAGIRLINVDDNPKDITVEYRFENLTDQGIYMKAMLNAEARGYLKRLPNLRWHREEQ